MTLKIENRLQKNILGFNIERNARKLIDVIPKQDLIGLERIIIVEEIKGKRKSKYAGVYKQRQGYQPSTIELSKNAIFKGMPKIFFLLPFIAKFTLAGVLYHEIGHHYHHKYKHGVAKQKEEAFAEGYNKKMLKKAFWGWRFFLRPLAPFARYLANRNRVRGK